MRATAAALSTLVIFLLLDAIWISQIALPQFRAHLGDALVFRPAPALLFYAIYMVGVTVFVLLPALTEGWSTALWRGALLGLVAYATYDLTNQATLRDWSWSLALSDIAWGAFVTGVSASLGLTLGDTILRWFRS
ncbi:DUF2177 family protein [Roseococcus sp.]|uniref:DUF2177 family protein n=1 Tax=Roseococcus sp. TaxID=2109646 RepID=UPI003BA8CBD9